MESASITSFLAHVSFERSEVENLVHRLEYLGFAFDSFDLISKQEPDNQNEFLISKESVINKILNASDDIERAFYLKYEDTFIALIPIVSPNKKTFFLFLRPALWQKRFTIYNTEENAKFYYEVDNARYAKLLLNIVEPYVLNGFDISYEEEYIEDLAYGTLEAKIIIGDAVEYHVPTLIYNILYNNMLIFDSLDTTRLYAIEDLQTKMINAFYSKSLFEFYIMKQKYWCKIRFEHASNLYPSTISILPIEPLAKKSFKDQQMPDIAFYAKLLLTLCDDFDIKELKTNFWPKKL